jgi:hypothetical protein
MEISGDGEGNQNVKLEIQNDMAKAGMNPATTFIYLLS